MTIEEAKIGRSTYVQLGLIFLASTPLVGALGFGFTINSKLRDLQEEERVSQARTDQRLSSIERKLDNLPPEDLLRRVEIIESRVRALENGK